jgi:hypothetical protein
VVAERALGERLTERQVQEPRANDGSSKPSAVTAGIAARNGPTSAGSHSQDRCRRALDTEPAVRPHADRGERGISDPGKM